MIVSAVASELQQSVNSGNSISSKDVPLALA
jgi:hypothetical protein